MTCRRRSLVAKQQLRTTRVTDARISSGQMGACDSRINALMSERCVGPNGRSHSRVSASPRLVTSLAVIVRVAFAPVTRPRYPFRFIQIAIWRDFVARPQKYRATRTRVSARKQFNYATRRCTRAHRPPRINIHERLRLAETFAFLSPV